MMLDVHARGCSAGPHSRRKFAGDVPARPDAVPHAREADALGSEDVSSPVSAGANRPADVAIRSCPAANVPAEVAMLSRGVAIRFSVREFHFGPPRFGSRYSCSFLARAISAA